MKFIKHTFIVLALAGMLGACRGGGNSNSNDAAPVIAANDSATITKTNAPEVAAAVYGSAAEAWSLSSSSGFTGTYGVISGAVVSTGVERFDIVTFVRQQISKLPDLQSPITDNTVVGIAIPPNTRSCPFGGTLTLSGEVADRSEPSAGDTFILEFDRCDSGSAGLVSGKFTMRFNSITGGPDEAVFGFDVTLTLENYSVIVAGETSGGEGEMRLVTPDANAASIEAELSGEALRMTAGNETTTLTNYRLTESVDAATNTFVEDNRGTLESSEFDGRISFETTVPFRSVDGDNYPSEGTMVVTGANSAALQLIALDPVNARLEIDADGDGAFEESFDTTWAELEQL